jgi:hypothetical protein
MKPDSAERVKRRFTRSRRAQRHATAHFAAYPVRQTPPFRAAPVAMRVSGVTLRQTHARRQNFIL